jgi:hypothetical protein
MSASDLATAAAEYHAHGWPMVPVNADKEATASFKQWKQRLQTAQEARAFHDAPPRVGPPDMAVL